MTDMEDDLDDAHLQEEVEEYEKEIDDANSVRGFGLLLALLLSCFGLVAAVASAKASHLQQSEGVKVSSLLVIGCYSTEMVYLVVGLALLGYLLWYLKSDTEEARRMKLKQDALNILNTFLAVAARNTRSHSAHHELKQCHFPSAFLLLTSILFGAGPIFANITDSMCDFAGGEELGQSMMKFFRNLLHAVFVGVQSAFFVLHSRALLHQHFIITMLPVSAIIGINTAFWFFAVGNEVTHVVLPHGKDGNSSLDLLSTAAAAAGGSGGPGFCGSWRYWMLQALYPMQIEYYVMNAVFAFLFVGNAGCRQALTRASTISQGLWTSIKQSRDPIGSMVFLAVMFGIAIVSTILVEFLRSKVKQNSVTLVLLVLLTLEHCACIAVGSWLLLPFNKIRRMLTRSKEEEDQHSECVSRFHPLPYVDTALLWLGVAAVLINDMYTVARTVVSFSDDRHSDVSNPNRVLLLICTMLNTVQSLLQACVLQVVHPKNKSLLLTLMSMNAVAWILYIAGFPLLFHFLAWDEGLVISTITMPLLVFFRFHCIGCCYEASGGFSADGCSCPMMGNDVRGVKICRAPGGKQSCPKRD